MIQLLLLYEVEANKARYYRMCHVMGVELRVIFIPFQHNLTNGSLSELCETGVFNSIVLVIIPVLLRVFSIF
jgi:hypothetical protein